MKFIETDYIYLSKKEDEEPIININHGDSKYKIPFQVGKNIYECFEDDIEDVQINHDYRLDLNKCLILMLEAFKGRNISSSILKLDTREGDLLSRKIIDMMDNNWVKPKY